MNQNSSYLCLLVEDITRRTLPEWQQAPALRGELFLLLDEQLQTMLGNYALQYDPERGLRYWKEASRQDG